MLLILGCAVIVALFILFGDDGDWPNGFAG